MDEVEVLGELSNIELARGKPTSQSSTGYGGGASRAVDGNTSGNWGHSSCTHTNKNSNEWWKVELGAQYSIDKVVVWNRSDCCADRLNHAKVMVDDAICGSLSS